MQRQIAYVSKVVSLNLRFRKYKYLIYCPYRSANVQNADRCDKLATVNNKTQINCHVFLSRRLLCPISSHQSQWIISRISSYVGIPWKQWNVCRLTRRGSQKRLSRTGKMYRAAWPITVHIFRCNNSFRMNG